jgi:hypothetical protein
MISRRSLLSMLAGAATVPTSAHAASSEQMRIAFVGDSMADGVWGGIQRRISKDVCLRQTLRTGRYGEIGTGLARADKFNWPTKVKTIMGEFHPHLFVVSFGLNDRNPVVEAGGKKRIDLTNPDWAAAYKEQVAAFLQSAASAQAGVIWLGIPVLRDEVSNKDALEKNAIFKTTVNQMQDKRLVYVEPWKLATSGEESFQPYFTDTSGSRIQLRATDGIHFTGAGYDLIANYLWPRMIDHLEMQTGITGLEANCR